VSQRRPSAPSHVTRVKLTRLTPVAESSVSCDSRPSPAATAAIAVQNPCPKSTSHNQPCHRVLQPSLAWAICLAMPASPPLTSTPSSRSTPSRTPAATGCPPRPPAAPPPTALPSPSCSTNCARRHPRGMEAGSPRPLPAPSGRHRHRPGRARHQVPRPPGGHRHHHPRRQARVPRVRTRSNAGSAGPSPPTSMTPARCPWETSTLPGIRSPWVITSPAFRGSNRRPAQMRRSRGTSRSCPLRSKQVSIQASWDRSSPPRPCPLNALPRVSMARTPRMNSARSCASTTDSPGSSSVAAVPGSQVCTDHGSG
jgi:hypothetical protein